MNRGARKTHLRLPAACLLIILPSMVYLIERVRAPDDGALIDILRIPPGGAGILIGEVSDPATPLRPGDQLLSIDGVPVEQQVRRALRLEDPTPPGELLHYRVVRGGEVLDLELRLAAGDALRQIGENWPSYLFLAYLLLVAAFIYLRRPEVAAAQTLLLASSAIFASGSIFFTGLRPSDLARPGMFWAFLWGSLLLYGFSMGAIIHFSLTFPRARPVLRQRPMSMVAIYAAPWIPYLTAVALGWAVTESASARLLVAMRASGLQTVIGVPLGLIVLLLGYVRNFDARERRQTRWLLWSGSVVAIPWIGLSVLPPLFGVAPLVPQFTLGVLWLVLPTAFAIAIVRESLFDIDRVINRTLVYALLTLVLAGVYFGVVVVLQQITEAVTGQQSPLAVVLSTLLIAAMFNPLRERIQTVIDRRFYRSHYDAARALDQLSLEMQRRVELTELSQSMLSVVQDSLQPVHLSLWLRQSERRQ